MDGPCLSDAELVVLARAGEAEALARLLERYRPSLYGVAVGLLRNRDDAGDAVQETLVVALARMDSLRDPAAVGGWLHQVLRNTCLSRQRRSWRTSPTDAVDLRATVPSAEDEFERLSVGDWLWNAVDKLAPDDRVTVMLRYFSRCDSYESIAAATCVPVGTVRSRLHRARSQLCDRLLRDGAGSVVAHAAREQEQAAEWTHFYNELHDRPEPRTYRDTYASDVEVTDGIGTWRGLAAWSAHEREAIALGVRAKVVGVVAGAGVSVVEIDFANPASATDHCPPRSTFVHRMDDGRSQRLNIHYV